MRIAMAVHGRFHAFDLARALIARGHDVQIFTNYPVWAVVRFGLPAERIHSFWPHGVLAKIIDRTGSLTLLDAVDPWLHRLFGRWAAKQIERGQWDVIHTFSGIAEEALALKNDAAHFLVRGSAHIRTQAKILYEESERVGRRLDRPNQWIIDREEREYQLSDTIFALSSFAGRSFEQYGLGHKVKLLPLGVNTMAFRPTAEMLEARIQRILRGDPLAVLFTGTINFRKGLYDFERVVMALDERKFRFRIVGTVTPEARDTVNRLGSRVELVPRQPQAKLPKWYGEADIYAFPTLEDGFAVVLTQAFANAIPLITTPNCAGPDFIRQDETGWVVPIRDPQAFIDRLNWCDSHREELASMVKKIYHEFQPHDWSDVAQNFERIALEFRNGSHG